MRLLDRNGDGATHRFRNGVGFGIGGAADLIVAELGRIFVSSPGSDTVFEIADLDADGDGEPDASDNCVVEANAGQADADVDAIGNACDGDFNQDGFVGGPDFDVFADCFNQPVGAAGPAADPTCAESDMNGDGFVGGPDFTLFLRVFNGPPGPSAPGIEASAAGINACGLGAELAPVLAGLATLARRRRRGR